MCLLGTASAETCAPSAEGAPTSDCGRRVSVTSDWHNALKLGYDVGGLRYPEWLVQFCATSLGRRTCGGDGENGDGGVLPTVVAPGGAFVAISGGMEMAVTWV